MIHDSYEDDANDELVEDEWSDGFIVLDEEEFLAYLVGEEYTDD
jgi:hypothetical protein